MHGTSINEVPGDWGELFVIEGSLYRTPRFNEFSKKKTTKMFVISRYSN